MNGNSLTITYNQGGPATVTLSISGPITGTTTWTDNATIAAAPPGPTMTFTVSAGSPNRPPVTYSYRETHRRPAPKVSPS